MSDPGDLPRDLPAPDGSGDHLHYRIARGRGGARTPVLLLHGLASNLSRWAEFVAATRLVATRDVLRVDLRGHGGSPTRLALSLELWTRDLEALRAAEGAGQWILVGHSLGAQVALHYAATHPARVRALVLIDPVFPAALRGRWRRLARWRPLFALLARLVRWLNACGLRRHTVAPRDLQALDREARVALQSPATEAEFVRRYSSATADLAHFRTAHYLQELVELFRPLPAPARYPQPVLLLLSTGATFAALDDTRAIAAGFPRATIATIGCHHWPLTEKPVEVRERIEDWIEALDTAAGAGSADTAAAARPHENDDAPETR